MPPMIEILLPALLLLIAAATDMARRVIPDWISAALVLTGLVAAARAGDPGGAVAALAVAAAVFLGGAVLFARGWMGGGDVKLAASFSLVAGAQGALVFLLGMSLVGGAMALAALLGGVTLGVARGQSAVAALARARSVRLPYGVAIAGGGLLALTSKL